jgi:CheY-like chemotaxis protein
MRRSNSILIVDDEPLFLEITAQALEDAGFKIAVAGNGEEALDSLADQPDMLLCDINMPRLDGWGVLDHIRQRPVRPRVVMMTGLREIVPPANVIELISGYLMKPFTAHDLIHTCDTVLGAPVVDPAGGRRKEPRRTFSTEATLLSEAGLAPVRGRLVQLSLHGFRLEVATSIQPGHPVRAVFRLPGREQPVRLRGHVRWKSDVVVGAETAEIDPEDEQVVRQLVGT